MGELQENEIQVWAVALNVPPEAYEALECVLSSDESARAARYHFEVHRRRFICGRAALRLILAEYLDMEPASLQFGYHTSGKPYLADTLASVSFNVAHCDDLALIAVAKEGDIGIDVEKVRWIDEFDDLVSRFFSRREASQFRDLRCEIKPAAFFNLWTRKEALLKATGDGICKHLDQVEVTFLPDEPARLLSLPQNGSADAWTLCDFVPAAGYVAALAARQRAVRFRCRRLIPFRLSELVSDRL